MNKLTIALCILFIVGVSSFKTFEKPRYRNSVYIKKAHRASAVVLADGSENTAAWTNITSWQFQHEKYETLTDEVLAAGVNSHPYVFGLTPEEKAKWQLGSISLVQERYSKTFEETKIVFELVQPVPRSRRALYQPNVPKHTVSCLAKRHYGPNFEIPQISCQIYGTGNSTDCLNAQADPSFADLTAKLPGLLSDVQGDIRINRVCLKTDTPSRKLWTLEAQTTTSKNTVVVWEELGNYQVRSNGVQDAQGYVAIPNLPEHPHWDILFKNILDVYFNGVTGQRQSVWVIRKIFGARDRTLPLGVEYNFDLLVRETYKGARPVEFQGRIVRANCNVFVKDEVPTPQPGAHFRNEIKGKAIVRCRSAPADRTLELGTLGNL